MTTGLEALETLARMTDTDIQTTELVDKWLLLTYDIPHTEEGDKARREFLAEARAIGATKHTESVYLLPWTKDAELLALSLAKKGEVCVWTSAVTDERKKKELTRDYDIDLENQLDELTGRVDRIGEHLEARRYKRAEKMQEKTDRLLKNLEQAIIRRGSAQLYLMLRLLQRRYGFIMVRVGNS